MSGMNKTYYLETSEENIQVQETVSETFGVDSKAAHEMKSETSGENETFRATSGESKHETSGENGVFHKTFVVTLMPHESLEYV